MADVLAVASAINPAALAEASPETANALAFDSARILLATDPVTLEGGCN